MFGSIYVVTNQLNGKFYIGQTRLLPTTRWSVHKSEAKRRPASYFHKAIRKHGADVFVLDVLATAGSQDELNRLEVLWILVTDAMERGYNLALGGDAAARTPATRAKMAAAMRGRKLSSETRLKMSLRRKGVKQTPAHRLARSVALKGRAPSLATRVAVGLANASRVHSPETRAKLSAAAQKANAVRWNKL